MAVTQIFQHLAVIAQEKIYPYASIHSNSVGSLDLDKMKLSLIQSHIPSEHSRMCPHLLSMADLK
jgi:hypothetical protein